MSIDIVNPYIKSLGSTDIMSSVEEKTLTVLPDQGSTGETVTSVPLVEAEMTKKLETEWLQFLKQKKEEEEIDKLVSDLYKENRNTGRERLIRTRLIRSST